MSALYSQYFWTWFILIYFSYLLWYKMNWMWSAWFSQLTVKVVQWIGSDTEEYPKFSTWLPFMLDVLVTPVLPPWLTPQELHQCQTKLSAMFCWWQWGVEHGLSHLFPAHLKHALGLWSLHLIKHFISVRAHGRMYRAHTSAASGCIPAVLAFISL